MSRLAALLLLAAAPALAADTWAVLAVADPPAGPDTDLAEATHQLRAACRDRMGGVLEAPAVRARLTGQEGGASLTELERAFGGATASLQNDEPDFARNALRGIVEELERSPESSEAYALWSRALARLAYLDRYLKNPEATAAALETLAATDPAFALDPVQYPPSFRREFEDVRRRVAAKPKVKLTITSSGSPATAYVNGREVGRTPLSLLLPAGTYRVGGASSGARVPSARVTLAGEERAVELDLALADALRPQAGPGLALPPAARGAGLVRAGAWARATRVIATSVAQDGGTAFLEAGLYDVARGTLLRAGRVRMTSGSVPAAQLAALAGFLVSGQATPGVRDVSPPPPPVLAAATPAAAANAPPGANTSGRRTWLKPAAYASGAVALGLAGVATWQGLTARNNYHQLDELVLPSGLLAPGADGQLVARKRAFADGARRNAFIAVGGTVLFAAAAGVFGWLDHDEHGAPVVRF
jgi:hypothetical protein